MPATMSLLGLYNWDSTILDGLIVPSGVDRSALINNLLRECAELEILCNRVVKRKVTCMDAS